jgi:hypothetical protein
VLDQTHLAPHGSLSFEPWRGILEKRPEAYGLTAAISHNNCPESLFAVLDLLRAQTLPPYIMVIDTGSPGPVTEQLLAHEAEHDDFEVHFIRSRSWASPVQPVCAAMDLAFSACQTEYLYSTHADVFLTRPDALDFLVSLCSYDHPAVGFQMSPREGSGNRDWEKVVGHCATVYHMPTMRRLGITWSILGACDLTGRDRTLDPGSWPDTEVMPSLLLQRYGYRPAWVTDPEADLAGTYLLLEDEPNRAYSTALFRHERVGASSMVYYRGTTEGEARKAGLEYHASLVPARIREWRESPPGATLRQVLPAIRECPFAAGRGPKRECGKLGRGVRFDDCCYCKLGPPEGQVLASVGLDWLG